jgi:hypothetical protein
MTELYINKRQVTLPEDFNITLTRENVHVTKRSDYTLDVTLSLLDPVNAAVFGYVHRLNTKQSITTGTAILICDAQEELNGTYTVTAITDENITLQLLADNSSFNFLLKTGYSTKKIWMLDFGTETAIDYARAKASMDGTNPNEKFLCVPVKFTDTIANDYVYETTTTNLYVNITGCNNIIMQPKFLYILEKLFSILGYTVAANDLRNYPRATKMFILNPIRSLRYAACLPDWTVDDFLLEVENLFNVEYIIDTKNSTVSIKKRTTSGKTVYVDADSVTRAYETECLETGDAIANDYDNVGYAVADTTYFKYAKLSDEVKDSAALKTFADLAAAKLYVDSLIIGTRIDSIVSTFRYYIISTNKYYIYVRGFIEVDQFRNVVHNADISVNELKIVPSSMVVNYLKWQQTITSSKVEDISIINNIPYSGRTMVDDTKSQTLTDLIENGITDIDRDSNLTICLFHGFIKNTNDGSATWTEASGNRAGTYAYYPNSDIDRGADTMRLYVDNSIFKEGAFVSGKVDSTKIEKFSLLLKDTKDVSPLYIINNKKFVCKKIEITIANGCKNPLVKGYFYPDNS